MKTNDFCRKRTNRLNDQTLQHSQHKLRWHARVFTWFDHAVKSHPPPPEKVKWPSGADHCNYTHPIYNVHGIFHRLVSTCNFNDVRIGCGHSRIYRLSNDRKCTQCKLLFLPPEDHSVRRVVPIEIGTLILSISMVVPMLQKPISPPLLRSWINLNIQNAGKYKICILCVCRWLV